MSADSIKKSRDLEDRVGGVFITFEGCEGSGKTTQAEMLKEYLLSEGIDVVLTREPGGTEAGVKIREILLESVNNIFPLAEALLFAADRAQQVQEVILPAFQKGWVVIGDRYADSSLAYQGVGRGIGLEAVKNLNEWATGGLQPTITFYLDMRPEESLKRKSGGSSDRMELESLQFHENVRQAYTMLRKLYPHRFVVIDATGKKDSIHARIVAEVSKIL